MNPLRFVDASLPLTPPALVDPDESSHRAGWVCLVGRPNVGKSTLLNQVLQTPLSIVHPKPQTTRNHIRGIFTDDTYGQIVFSDTPGIHRAQAGGVNQFMMGEVEAALEGADLIWYLLDPQTNLSHEQLVMTMLQRWQHRRSAGQDPQQSTPLFLILNKVDQPQLHHPDRLLESVQRSLEGHGYPPRQIFRISARSGLGMKTLMEASWSLMPRGQAFYPDADQLSDRSTQFFAAELIRQQIFGCAGEEIPYAAAVEITRFDDAPRTGEKLARIEATIHVERESQKGMLIGAGGIKIKEIGTRAREALEKFLGCRLFVGLRVGVLEDWSKDPVALHRLGYPLRGRTSRPGISQKKRPAKKRRLALSPPES